MSGIYFEYTPGHIVARFTQAAEFDYIELHLRMGGEVTTTQECGDDGQEGDIREEREEVREHSLYMSSVFCPFEDFIRFREAITLDVQEVAFEWDAEGPTGAMRWHRRRRGESGHLMVEWSSRGASFVHTTFLYTRDTVAGLYGALRSFAESADYNPFRYERLTLGESVPLLVPGTTADDLADRLVWLDGFAAMTAIGSLVSAAQDSATRGGRKTFPIEHFLDPAIAVPADYRLSAQREQEASEWDAADQTRRRQMLDEEFSYGVASWHGCNLRALRSRLIEEWLAKPASDGIG